MRLFRRSVAGRRLHTLLAGLLGKRVTSLRFPWRAVEVAYPCCSDDVPMLSEYFQGRNISSDCPSRDRIEAVVVAAWLSRSQ